MKKTILMAGLLASLSPIAARQASARTPQTASHYVIVDGDVVRYEGRTMVVRGADGREIIYTIGPSVVVPTDVRIGRHVRLYTEPGADGTATTVTRVTTTSLTPEGNVKRTTEETRTSPSGETTRSVTTTVGDVVRYEPNRTIVVRDSNGREMSYVLSAGITVPADVRIGRRVTLYTEPSADGGSQTVSRVVVTTLNPDGTVKRTTEDTRTLPSGDTATTRTVSTEVSGTVDAYEAGRLLTITDGSGTQRTYIITSRTTLPDDLVVGKMITIVPGPPDASGQVVVRTVRYKR